LAQGGAVFFVPNLVQFMNALRALQVFCGCNRHGGHAVGA